MTIMLIGVVILFVFFGVAFAAATEFEKFQAAIPLRKEIHLPMVANSMTEVAVQIDTDIPAGAPQGWIIYGLEYQFRITAAPHTPLIPDNAAQQNGLVQLCRGDVPDLPVWLDPGDHDLILEENYGCHWATNVGFEHDVWPRFIAKNAVTQLGHLYLLYGTSQDDITLSATTNELYAEILYHVVKAPKARGDPL